MLFDLGGEFGVDGSSGVDKDKIFWGLSSARTPSAGVPLLEFRFKRGVSRILEFCKMRLEDRKYCSGGLKVN